MEFSEIQELIRILSKSKLTELKIEKDNFKISLKKTADGVVTYAPAAPALMPQTVVQAAPAVATQAPASEKKETTVSTPTDDATHDANLITFKSPMIGTFYRKPSPDKDVFVNVGDTVNPGDVLCIIEAMKLFNEIENEISGTIVKVLVEDSSPVEYDQPLFLIEPR